MNANGKDEKRLTGGPAGDYDPAFSPDGKRVVFVRYDSPTNRNGIYIQALKGGSARLVPTDPNCPAASPVFSPKGNKIAFVFNVLRPCGIPSGIATIRPDGTHLRVIHVGNEYTQPQALDFSPNGRSLVFGLYDYDTGFQSIETVRVNGTHEQTVYTPGPPFTEDNLEANGPVYSPDGKKIAFSRGGYLWTINPDGSGLSDLGKQGGGFPDWQPLYKHHKHRH